MPIPRELLKAAFASLSLSSLRKCAQHSCPKRGSWNPDQATADELAAQLAKEDVSLSGLTVAVLTKIELKKIGLVLGIDTVQPEDQLRIAVSDFVFKYDEREKLNAIAAVPALTRDEMMAEIKRMARPCVFLSRNSKDGPLAGMWGSDGLVAAPKGKPEERPEELIEEEDDCEKYRHWISLDCKSLPEELAPLDLNGVISIYSDEWSGYTTKYNENQNGYIAHDPSASFPVSASGMTGVPLYAKPGLSYPSRFQMIMYPTPVVRDWLARMGHTFTEDDLHSLAARKLSEAYEKVIFLIDPLFEQERDIGTRKMREREIVAVIGGWTIDMDFTYAAVLGDKCYQLVYTLEDSEPWMQAFIDKTTHERFIRRLST